MTASGKKPRSESRWEGGREIEGTHRLSFRGPSTPVELELADLIAERVAARLTGGRQVPSRELIDASEVARILGCRRSWVYEHKSELPLVRLGAGSRPRLRFERAKVEAMAASSDAERTPEAPAPIVARRRRRHPPRSAVKLLEIKGRPS